MLLLMAFLSTGAAIGYLLRRAGHSLGTERAVFWTVALLLSAMGLSMGKDRDLIGKLHSLGADALFLACACTLGSIATGLLAYRLCFKKRGNE